MYMCRTICVHIICLRVSFNDVAIVPTPKPASLLFIETLWNAVFLVLIIKAIKNKILDMVKNALNFSKMVNLTSDKSNEE